MNGKPKKNMRTGSLRIARGPLWIGLATERLSVPHCAYD